MTIREFAKLNNFPIADLDHHDIGALGMFVARVLNKVGGSSESIGDIVHIAQNALRQRGQFSKGHRASRLMPNRFDPICKVA